ncbi:hypothetical protein NORO109296_22190 [Nocardiopsis rhodophaea]
MVRGDPRPRRPRPARRLRPARGRRGRERAHGVLHRRRHRPLRRFRRDRRYSAADRGAGRPGAAAAGPQRRTRPRGRRGRMDARGPRPGRRPRTRPAVHPGAHPPQRAARPLVPALPPPRDGRLRRHPGHPAGRRPLHRVLHGGHGPARRTTPWGGRAGGVGASGTGAERLRPPAPAESRRRRLPHLARPRHRPRLLAHTARRPARTGPPGRALPIPDAPLPAAHGRPSTGPRASAACGGRAERHPAVARRHRRRRRLRAPRDRRAGRHPRPARHRTPRRRDARRARHGLQRPAPAPGRAPRDHTGRAGELRRRGRPRPRRPQPLPR